MEGALYILFCVLLINSCAATTGREKPKPHVHADLTKLSEKDHDMKDEYNELSPEEAAKRLRVLIVKKVDSDKDGFVTEEELTKWVREVSRKNVLEGNNDYADEMDTNHDGQITWDEYMQALYGPEELDEEAVRVKNRTFIRFEMADKDKDGTLSKEEFSVHFMQPELSTEGIQDIHVLLTIEVMDHNKDGTISLKEFLGDYRLPADSGHVKKQTERFHQHDTNHDDKIDKDEAKLWILSSSHLRDQEEAQYLLSTADDNKDGKLSEEEIVKNHETFVELFDDSEGTDYGHALPKHEEL
ncbi:hypothetical protein OS493_019753 [Desmophyllum pertusum]|uniref:Reticulocalbin-3 n=1 Tax=Desmophyllum pertusum TaxID=174260 RepID=A0A9W9Z343_9CNID|nr:hypothetical protein OS493_019753 [Desmophyllum pertusum]